MIHIITIIASINSCITLWCVCVLIIDYCFSELIVHNFAKCPKLKFLALVFYKTN